MMSYLFVMMSFLQDISVYAKEVDSSISVVLIDF